MTEVHPYIKNEVNEEQLTAVTNMKNCVVAAGAGSGKTRVLAFRFAHLIVDKGLRVDSILTLTFTKKATAEMFSRIYKTLQEIEASDVSTLVHKTRARTAIENFHTARIQTIDSFCSSIVRSSSKEYGIRPDFTINIDAVEDYCKKTARDFMLKHRDNSYLQELLGSGKFEDLTETLFVNPIRNNSSIASPIDFFGKIPLQTSFLCTEWDASLDFILNAKYDLEEIISDCEDAFNELEQHTIDGLTLQKYFSLMQDKTLSDSQKEELSQSIQVRVIPFMKNLHILYKLPLPRSNKAYKSVLLELRKKYIILTSIAQYILYFRHTLKILPLLQDYQNEITEWKRLTGNLTYSDVSSLALHILLENIDIRNNEKKKTDAIMIDEFQDNNRMQKEMLFLIAEKIERTDKTIPQASELCPEKLFFVGDEKQSIYKFRGADVSVFRELKDELEGNNLTLSTNYRSHAQLLSSFNALFGGYDYEGARSSYDRTLKNARTQNTSSVFLQEHQLLDGIHFPLFEAEYTKSFSKKPENDKDEDNKRVHICLLNTTKQEKNDNDEEAIAEDTDVKENLVEAENIAVYTAEKIAELCMSTKTLSAKYSPSNIAILFRSYGKQYLYEKHLRRLGIPYIAENITNFFGDAPVNDIAAMIRLVVYPYDSQAFATVLRSPFVGLSQQESLLCLSSISSQDEKKTTLFCEENANILIGSAKCSYIKGLERYQLLKEKAENLSCSDMIQWLWYNEGYRFETIWSLDVNLFAEFYDFLFEIARQIDSEGKNLSYFSDYLHELNKHNERLDDMNIPLERGGAVQLLSIHKSKGLEFPVVFVSSLSTSGKNNTNSDKLYIDEQYGPSLNFPTYPEIADSIKNYFFNQSSSKEKQMSEAELRRLLYVAMTRAETELYLTASYNINKDVQKALLKNAEGNNETKDESEKELYTILEEIWNDKSKKAKIEKTVVNKDYCVENDTLFAFLLPQIVSYAHRESPFSIHTISAKSRNQLITSNIGKKPTKNEVYNRLLDDYNQAPTIETPIVPNPYISPSQLYHTKDLDYQKGDNKDNGEHAIKELDDIIRLQKEHGKENGFDYSHFGTIAHAFADSAISRKPVEIAPQIEQLLSEKQLHTVYTIAKKMVDGFINSDLGKEALCAKEVKTEHSFKLLIKKNNEKIIISGQIDLVYQNADGKMVIVDYKTDSVEEPSIHIAQLAAYQRAIAKIYQIPLDKVLCNLFYLRSGNTLDMTQETLTINLENVL